MRGRVVTIMAAAGTSSRMGGLDKLFVELDGQPLLAHTVGVFEGCPAIQEIVLVVSEANLQNAWDLSVRQGWHKVTSICRGGQRRQDSVKQGLLQAGSCDWVVIHDGARPLVTREIIEKGLAEAKEHGAAVAAVPVKDTIKVAQADLTVRSTLDRSLLWVVQTPQVFRYDLIYQGYTSPLGEATDDAMLLERLGVKVKLYMGSYENIKVTTPEDFALAELIYHRRKASG
jgi:2-C-methyl-D-erythritol 4-phosphate cytidylyltransferase